MGGTREHGSRVGVDIGGTFTDIVLQGPGGEIGTKKLPSTPRAFGQAVVRGLVELCEELGVPRDKVGEIVHGTTVVTNAIIERAGARVGLVTTKGFRDVLEIGRGRLPAIYDLSFRKPVPLVPRHLRLEVTERIDARGVVLQPADPEEIVAVVDRVLALEVEAVAVCLINAPANPRHERLIGEILARRAPRLPVSLSCDVMPMIMEYERSSETVLNAYVTPVVAAYLGRLRQDLAAAGFTAPLRLMQSSGGMTTPETSARRPIEIVECGPAAGVVGAAHLARAARHADIVSFDMGGTTAKASLVEGGRLTRSAEYEVGAGLHRASRLLKGQGYPLRVPAIDIAEVGAGGGSLIDIDLGGALQIGPRSAGAEPGPVCYGRGGTVPTLTDANVVLGYVNPEHLCGGAFPIDAAGARAAIERGVANALGKEVHAAALDVHLLANAYMMRAIRAVSSERGRDPRRFRLYAFGGAGPIHATGIAAGLGIATVVVPPLPGVFSAYGLLCADPERHYVRHLSRPWGEAAIEEVERGFAELEADALASAETWAGGADTRLRLERALDLLYEGQGSRLTVPIGEGPLGPGDVARIVEDFVAAHRRDYGHDLDGLGIRIAGLRLTASLPRAEAPAIPAAWPRAAAGKERAPSQRLAFWGGEHGLVPTPVARPEEVDAQPRPGPLLVDAYDTTVVVPPGASVARGEAGELVVTLQPGGARG